VIVVGALMLTASAILEVVMRWMEEVSSRYPADDRSKSS
jgi:hypothetical protein